MMPVEEGKTSSGLQAKILAAAAQVARAAARPGSPAAQLALPALMAATRTWPPVAREMSLVDDERCGGDAIGGEDGGGAGRESATMRAKSVRPLFLRPALAAPKRKPRGRRNWETSDMSVSVMMS